MDVRFGALKPTGFKDHQNFNNKEGKMDAIGFRAYDLLNKALDAERLGPVKEAISDKVELNVKRDENSFQLTTRVAGKDVFSSKVGPDLDESSVASALDTHVAEAVKQTVKEKLNTAVESFPTEFRPEAKVSFPGDAEAKAEPAAEAAPKTAPKAPLPFDLDKVLPTDLGGKIEDAIRGMGDKLKDAVPKLPVPGLDKVLKGADLKTLLTLVLGAPKKSPSEEEKKPSFPSLPGLPDLGGLKDLLKDLNPEKLKDLIPPDMSELLKDPMAIPGLPEELKDILNGGTPDPEKLKEKLPGLDQIPGLGDLIKDGKIDPEKLKEIPGLKDLLGGGALDPEELKKKLPIDKIPGADEILKDGKVDTNKLLETIKKQMPGVENLPGFEELTKDPEKLQKTVEEILKKFKK